VVTGGVPAAFRSVVGNVAGVAGWALLSALGVAALVAVSEAAFVTLKVVGAVVLVWLGVQALRGARRESKPASDRRIVGEAFLTSAANPTLAVFFVALFPGFIPAGEPVLPRALAMAALVIAFDFMWYLTLAALVSRAGRAVVGSRLARRLEQLTGAVLLALAGRLALERR
jgi:threonine/homoserine/homoserine lactone efflux protein